MLKFSQANAKTEKLASVPRLKRYLLGGRKVYSFDLLSGRACPYAEKCHSRVVIRKTGKANVVDGPKCEYRCFSASQEALYPPLYQLRRRNLNKVRCATRQSFAQVRDLIVSSLPPDAGIVRLHVGGDFFHPTYLEGWVAASETRQDILFYTYTKSLPYLYNFKFKNISQGVLRKNFLLTASRGGSADYLIDKLGIRSARVVYSESATDLPIDHNDSHAATPGGNFALLIHGTQPKGSEAGKAVYRLRGAGSYTRKGVVT